MSVIYDALFLVAEFACTPLLRTCRVWITTPEFGEKRYKAEVLGVCFDLDLAMLR